MRGWLNLFRFVGLRHLRERKVRAVFTVLGVACGVSLFTSIDLINRATLASFRENFLAMAGQASLTVTAGETGFPEDKLAVLEKVKGVKRAVPMIEERVYFSGSAGSETLAVFGIDLLKEQAVRSYQTEDGHLMDDPLIFLNQPDSLIVSSTFAAAHHLKIDSKVRLATAHGGKQFTVRGLLSPEGPAKAYGGAMALMDIDGARVTFGKPDKVDRVDLVAQPDEDLAALAERCRQALGPAYQVEKPEGQADQMARMVQSYQRLLSVLSFLAMLVGLFMITNTIGMAVTERRKEIGILRAIGTSRGGVLVVFLAEAAMMGLVGALLGAWLGWFGSRYLVATILHSIAAQQMTQISVPVIQWQSADLARAALVGLVSSLLAAGWPAFRATKIQPIEAIREGAKNQPGAIPPAAIFVGVACLAFLQLSSSLEWNSRFLWVEGLNQIASTLGAILVTPFAARTLVRLFTLVTRFGSMATRLSQENLLREPMRVSGNVLMLMTGLILMVLISAVNASFRDSIDGWMGKVLRADLLVASPGQIYSYRTQPLDQGLRAEIEAIPGLRETLAYPVTGMRFMHLPFEKRSVAVKAYDRPIDANLGMFDVRSGDPVAAARALFDGTEFTVLASQNFAAHFHRTTGDRIQILSPGGPVSARIAGIVTDFSSSDGVLYFDRAKYARLWNDPLVTLFYVKLKDGADPENARRLIDSSYGRSRNLMVRLNSELRRDLAQSVDQNFSYARAVEGAALFIALLGLLNALYMSVMERTREIGLLHAIGMTRAQIIHMVVLESLAQGLIATILAVALGSWMSYLWIRHSLESVLGWTVQFHFPLGPVFTACGLGLAVAFLAGLFPARRAASLEIKEALNYE